jgi:diadenosine tetraphosphate (Ap4A) HIT family hydrolase
VSVANCYVCRMSAAAELPVRERIVEVGGWRLAHAFDTTLPGWLVLAPTRHVSALHELTADEAATMGGLLVRASAALRDVVGCAKTYTMLFAEAEGFAHLHVHVVPRMSWFTPEQVGPKVFAFLGAPASERLDEAARDQLSLALQSALAVG